MDIPAVASSNCLDTHFNNFQEIVNALFTDAFWEIIFGLSPKPQNETSISSMQWSPNNLSKSKMQIDPHNSKEDGLENRFESGGDDCSRSDLLTSTLTAYLTPYAYLSIYTKVKVPSTQDKHHIS